MLTIGIAGHIDHGKSSLVKALTNIDPDRLPEEKTRGMTLDLGFAWLELPTGEKIGIVDVPGHEHFVRNVIPGMSGIDGAILVVAADDSWMPQTEEHMQIINQTGIKNCIIALNKIDLVDDNDWLELVETEITDRVKGTMLEEAPIIRVSARDGIGIEEMKSAIAKLASKAQLKRDIGRPRLPVDRVFTIKGSGVVVTGTLTFGSLSCGDEVKVLPQGITAGIRGIESYKEASGKAEPGTRVALNLSGVKKEDLNRGNIIVPAHSKQCVSKLLNIELRLINSPGLKLKNGEEIVVYVETGEYLAHVTLLEKKELRGGEVGLAQLNLSRQAPSFIGQRLTARKQSPADTIGGGVVLDPSAYKFKTRHARNLVNWLKMRRTLELEQLILTELEKCKYLELNGILSHSRYSDETIKAAIESLATSNVLKTINGYVLLASDWHTQKDKLVSTLSAEHRQNPLKRGITQAALQVSLELPKEIFGFLISELLEEEKIVSVAELLALPGHKPEPSDDQRVVADKILDTFTSNPTTPPTIKELASQFPDSEKIIYYLIEKGLLTQLPEGVLLQTERYNHMKAEITDFLKANGRLVIQDINRMFGLSRKYSIPLLNQLDKEKITRREGDERVLV